MMGSLADTPTAGVAAPAPYLVAPFILLLAQEVEGVVGAAAKDFLVRNISLP